MSKHSLRKRMSRKEIKRRQQLKEEEQRKEIREKEATRTGEFMIEEFFLNHLLEIVLIILFVAGLWAGRSFIQDYGASDQVNEAASKLVTDRAYEWGLKYPQGYKIIVLTDKNMIQTSYDSLPKELEINWRQFKIMRIKANQMAGEIEKIKFKLNDVNYAPENVSGLSVTTTISRDRGARTRLAQLGKKNLFIEIIEDEGHQLFCLLGLTGG